MHAIWETLTLGELIDALAECPPDAPVFFDFAGLTPGEFASYRGDYSHLVLTWQQDAEPENAVDVLTKAMAAVGQSFMGYKGGLYRMSRETPVWVDQKHLASGTGIKSVETVEGTVYLCIGLVEYD